MCFGPASEIETILQKDPRYNAPPKNWKSDSHYCLPFQGAESLTQSGERVAKHLSRSLSKLHKKIQSDTLKIFVGHGASFRHAAWHLKVIPFNKIKQLSMHHASPLFFEWTKEGELKHIAGEWKQRKKTEEFSD